MAENLLSIFSGGFKRYREKVLNLLIIFSAGFKCFFEKALNLLTIILWPTRTNAESGLVLV